MFYSSGYNPNTSLYAGMSQPQLASLLTQAQTALVDLQLGKSAVTISYAQADGNRSVTFRKTDLPSLMAMVMQLQQQLGFRGVRRRPLTPTFI